MSITDLEKKYKENVLPMLMKELRCDNVMQLPKLSKIAINMGLGEAIQDSKLIDMGLYTLSQISGQKPVVARAKKSISNFKLREGQPIGCYVTLRADRMYEFFERFVNFAIPRVRDFKGLSGKSFDGHGNYTVGLKEQLVFPEIEYDKITKVKGINITIITTSKNDNDAKVLLKMLGMPFRN